MSKAPHDPHAEAALLGAAMLSAEACELMLLETAPEDFYVPTNRNVREAIEKAWREGAFPDAVVVAERMAAMGTLDAAGGPPTLIEMIGNVPAIGNATRYSAIVVGKAMLRRLQGVAAEIVNVVKEDPSEVGVAIDSCRALFDNLVMPVRSRDLSPTIDDLLSVYVDYDWVVPKLLERSDRLILTGPEGKGKSTLLRQLAICVASGIHPFNSARTEPRRVLMIDCENPLGIMQRKFRQLHAQASGDLVPEFFRIERRPEGLDLLSRRDAQWLYDVVAANQPDVLMLGPIYKLHNEDPSAEQPARKVQHVLDVARSRFGGCALILEAHSPHGPRSSRDLRPIGSSAWLRWPEFGFGIRPEPRQKHVYRFEEWRGSREERDWPEAIVRGGKWPWSATTIQEAEPDREPVPDRW